MDRIFDRVVCGVDESQAGETAARLAARLTAPDGELTLVTVEDPSIALRGGWRGTALAAELRQEAEHALARGLEQVTP
ncbi:MAG: universal stress protein, partial [Actinobacteria bacterium]|nr:universal stress protein [Actinomycetota bacterium]